MALTKVEPPVSTGPVADASVAPAFEPLDEAPAANDAAIPATPAANDPAPTQATVKAAPVRPVAVVPARPVAIAAPTLMSRETVWDRLQNQIGSDVLEDMGIGAFPRYTVNNGGSIVKDKSTPIGERIKVEVQSWNLVWLITTGEQDDAEANKLIRTSYDGVNLKGGEGTISQYIEGLKLQGYEKASFKKYVEMYALVVETTKLGVTTVVPADERVLVQVSVSPQSVALWQAHMLSAKLRLGRGIEDDAMLVLTGATKTLGARTFGIINFSPK